MGVDVKHIKESKEMPHLRTLMMDLIDCLSKQGFTDEFMMTEKGLMSLESKEIMKPEDLEVVEFHRFEGISDPDDMAILYAIVTKSGLKGTLVDAYGVYGDQDIMEFMKDVSRNVLTRNSDGIIHKCDEHL